MDNDINQDGNVSRDVLNTHFISRRGWTISSAFIRRVLRTMSVIFYRASETMAQRVSRSNARRGSLSVVQIENVPRYDGGLSSGVALCLPSVRGRVIMPSLSSTFFVSPVEQKRASYP